MLSSDEKRNFINEYMSAYEEKIKMANKYGLFDAAKMFELFAIEVCKLWFGQGFTNLNKEKSTYPFVDLISDDMKLFVQVTTVEDIPRKIKTTLEKIRDSKDERFSVLNNVLFFVLTNDSVEKVQDYNGDKQIGNIPFTKKDNLITTRDIINKVENSSIFLNNLYNVLKLEFEQFNECAKELNEAVQFSRSVGLKNIIGLINGEYEIDRSALLNKIKEDNAKFVTVLGNAGSGKSALCKKIVQDENIVLYARAERLAEATDINEIWKCDIKAALEYLNGKKIVFFIDALEFIADCSDTKFELLQYLYAVVKNYKYAYILTSCRSSDKSAFIKLESNFTIEPYEVEDLMIDELILIMERYPIIQRMHDMKSYSDLLKSPFYINMIVSRSMDIDNIGDESAFREHIWKNVICLQETLKKYKITYSQASAAITKIVFERAKNFSLGIPEDRIDSNVVQALISEDIIIRQGQENIRLKYDIFEDICFEHYFDGKFDECKGEYQLFYDEIGKFERCAYRRYQIWVSNKLFIKSNRDKFLYYLIFSKGIPQEWKKQTEIGIVKSRFCNNFFEEYGMDIVDSEVLIEFIKVTNLFAFEARIISNEEMLQMLLLPIGNGRPRMIQIIESEHIYEKDIIKKDDIIKLCWDYARQNNRESQTSLASCTIMEYYIGIEKEIVKHCKFIDAVKQCLEAVYLMADVSNEWIRKFWNILIDDFRSNSRRKKRIAEETIEWTLKNTSPILVKEMAKELCLLADVFWLDRRENCIDDCYLDGLNKEKKYGLSENSEYCNYTYRSVYHNVFLWNLFSENFEIGFQWVIQFVNMAAIKYATDYPKEVIRVTVQFVEEQLPRKYWGNSSMWLAGIVENSMPVLLGDIIFGLTTDIIMKLEYYKQDEKFIVFANQIKKDLYLKSNNVALLTIIERIGMHFERELPGYLLDLITCKDIMRWDISRCILYEKDPTIDLLKKQINMSIGIPNISKRYSLDNKCNMSMRHYISNIQECSNLVIQEKCRKVLDFVQDMAKNDFGSVKGKSHTYKDDLIKNKEINSDSEITALESDMTDKIEKIIHTQKTTDPIKMPEQINKKCSESISNGEIDLKLVLNEIVTILNKINASVLPVQYEADLVRLIAIALSSKELSVEDRSLLCKLWITGINRFFSNGSFVFDISLFPSLLKQMDEIIDFETQNEIKRLVVNCLLYTGSNGLIDRLADYVKKYLLINKNLARLVFNTITKLAEDEMNHQKFNANFIKTHERYNDFIYVPNMQPKLSWADREIKNEGAEGYNSQKEEIFTKYLFEEEDLQIQKFDISNYDILTLCYVANCGLNFDNELFEKVIHNVLTCMFDIWKYHDRDYDGHKIVGTFQEHELVELYRREMIEALGDAKTVIDTLFNDIDFSKFTSQAVEFYKDIFGNFLLEFFDAHEDSKRRDCCKKKIKYIEQKVELINVDYVRLQLYQSLMLSVTRYCRRDWSKYRTSYSFRDKQFLNEQFSKYGKYHVGELLETINQLHINELLPEILVSIRNSFRDAKTESNKFAKDIQEQRSIVNMIILKAFVKYGDMIKEDQKLSTVYQDILEILIDLNYEEAAVILDEFRVH